MDVLDEIKSITRPKAQVKEHQVRSQLASAHQHVEGRGSLADNFDAWIDYLHKA
jgi:hypothetical protein